MYSFTFFEATFLERLHTKINDSDYISFSLMNDDGFLTNAGVLLADQNIYRHNRIFCTRWNGLNKTSLEEASDDDEYSGGLVKLLDSALNFVKKNTKKKKEELSLISLSEAITKDNINEIIKNAGIEGDIGILSVDIDGNDYWVLNAIDCVRPRILICEYNALFGEKEKVTIPYDDNFFRTSSHYSNLYFGASLAAFKDYAEKHGYYYFGSNSAGNNAFFVRKDSVNKELIPKYNNEFAQIKFRESKNKDGKLSFLRGKERLEIIKDMPLVDLTTGEIKKISSFPFWLTDDVKII